MQQKVIIITGSSKGIGRHLAEHYLAHDYIVAGCSRSRPDINHSNYHHYELDVSDETAVTNMVRSVNRKYGKIDALLNNAGIATMNAALLTPGSSIEGIYRTNTFGAFYFARETAKIMIRRKCGRIVFFTTVASPLRLEGELAYASSKAAIESITQIMAKEVGSVGITVNAIGPTPVETDLISNVSKEHIQDLLEKQAVKRLGKMDDITHVVDFFLNERSDFITGQILYLGGVVD